MFPQAAPKEPRQEYMAPLEQRHDVYYDLLALLSLSEHDFLDLLGRGLTLADACGPAQLGKLECKCSAHGWPPLQKE